MNAPSRIALIVCGVSGSGKTTFAVAAARALGIAFMEGDSFHPPSNVRKMSAGIALSDDDRWPWLAALATAVVLARDYGGVVATCSALKRSYRDYLRRAIGQPLFFVCLTADSNVLAERMRARHGHFMPEALLASQLDTFEAPSSDEHVLVLPSPTDVATILPTLRKHVGLLDCSHTSGGAL